MIQSFFVSKPTRIMYSAHGLNEKVIYSKCKNISRIIVALNVGFDENGTYVFDEKKQGIHWTLLAVDLKNNIAYYGDSLGWPLPNNFTSTVGSNFKRMEEDLGINIMNSLKHLVIINNLTNDTVNGHSCFFYPIQSCSNVCGIIVVCMAAALCDQWNSWLTRNNQMDISLLSSPTINSTQLRLIVLSWIVNNQINVHDLVHKMVPSIYSTKSSTHCDNVHEKIVPIDSCEGKLTFNNFGTIEVFSQDDSDHTSDMDDFTSSNTTIKTHSYIDSNDCESDDEFIKTNNFARPLILGILPEGYSYKMLTVSHFEDLESFTCNFKIKLENEESARRWIAEYNVKTKETMVFDCCKKLSGKRVLKKLYLRCQHKQRQTGKHKKSDKALKTTHKGHNNKNTDCPAQIVVTILL